VGYLFLCTFAATFNRSTFNRMKPVAAAWLQALALVFIGAIVKVHLWVATGKFSARIAQRS
jgi:hypothetical protein